MSVNDYISKEYWTRQEVAHYMNKSVKTINNYKAKGLVFSRVGMITKETFLTWLDEQ